MLADLVLFNQTCLLVHWKSKRKATWLMPLRQTCQLTLWNFISQDCYIDNTTCMLCRVVMSLQLQLQHICLLAKCYYHKHHCWSNMPTGWVLLQDGCLLDCGHSIIMPADLLSLNIACLLALCFSSCYNGWYGVSLSAVSAGMVLAISRTCWCNESL